MFYGGLDIETTVRYPDELHCTIEKKLIPNDQFWLFDIINCKFREIKLSVHPSYSSIFSTSIPRFGHSMVSVSIEENKSMGNKSTFDDQKNVNNSNMNNIKQTYSTSYKEPSTIFVMGGYKWHDSGTTFIAMNDLWKCDFFLDSNGTSDQAVASPISNFSLVDEFFSYIIDNNLNKLPNYSNNSKFTGVFNHSDTNWPAPRGFFSLNLIDSSVFSNFFKWKDDDISSDNSDLNFTYEKKHDNDKDSEKVDEVKIFSPNPIKKKHNINLAFTPQTFLIDKSKSKSTRSATTSISSNSSNNNTSSSQHSPFSMNNLHTSSIASLKNKILFVLGGSSIMYTKVVNENNFDILYNKSILNDSWIYDFQTELWYRLTDIARIKQIPSICGHQAFISGSYINIIGGIQKVHYDKKTFEFFHVNNNNDNENLFDKDGKSKIDNWENGLKCCQKFYYKEDDDTGNLVLSQKQNLFYDSQKRSKFYATFALDLKRRDWKIINVSIIYNVEFFGPWSQNDNLEYILSGGVYTDVPSRSQKLNKSSGGNNDKYNDDDDENNENNENGNKNANGNSKNNERFKCIKYRRRLNHTIAFTNAPVIFKDNKLVLFAPDIKLLDKDTNKYVDEGQTIIGNGITEIYSTYL